MYDSISLYCLGSKDLNYQTDVWLHVSCQQPCPYVKSLYDVSSFIWLRSPIRKFPTLIVSLPCLLPPANLHRSFAIIAVTAVFVCSISDSIVTSCRTYSGAPRTCLLLLFSQLIHVILKTRSELAIEGIFKREWCFQLTPNVKSAREYMKQSWYITPHDLLEGNRRYGGTYCFHLQGLRINNSK
jgi:hypothetical protein